MIAGNFVEIARLPDIHDSHNQKKQSENYRGCQPAAEHFGKINLIVEIAGIIALGRLELFGITRIRHHTAESVDSGNDSAVVVALSETGKCDIPQNSSCNNVGNHGFRSLAGADSGAAVAFRDQEQQSVAVVFLTDTPEVEQLCCEVVDIRRRIHLIYDNHNRLGTRRPPYSGKSFIETGNSLGAEHVVGVRHKPG